MFRVDTFKATYISRQNISFDGYFCQFFEDPESKSNFNFYFKDLKLNRVEIDETVEASSPGGGARPKRRKKCYDLNHSDSFWLEQKGRYAQFKLFKKNVQ